MAVKANINLKNTSIDDLYIDADNIVSAKRAIKTDLTNIVNTLNSIETHYKVLRDHKSTKGKWKDVSSSCVKACNKYEKKFQQDKKALEDCIDDAVQKYVLSQIEELKKAESAANTIIS